MRTGWSSVPFEDVCVSMTKGPFGSDIKKSLYVPKSEDTYKVYIQANAIEKDACIGEYYISKDYFESKMFRFEVKPNDYIITCDGALGRYLRLPEDIERGIISASLLKVTLNNNRIVPRFFEFLWDGFIMGKLTSDIRNSALVHLPSASKIGKVSVPLPSLDEQEHIVAELDLLQGIIDKQKAQLKELDTLAQSIFYDMFGDPAENEKGWEVKEMGELFDIGSSKRVFESQWTDRGVPFYRAREIVRMSKNEPIEAPIFISEELFKEYSMKYGIPSAGDMMITAVGTLGVSYIVKDTDRFYFQDGSILWFKSKGLCEPRFIKDEYATDYVMNQIRGNANAAVVGTYTIMNANRTRVVVPPMKLQREYVEKVEAIDKQKASINESIVQTQKLFDYTMDKYFG